MFLSICSLTSVDGISIRFPDSLKIALKSHGILTLWFPTWTLEI